jgi:hypothetical protein
VGQPFGVTGNFVGITVLVAIRTVVKQRQRALIQCRLLAELIGVLAALGWQQRSHCRFGVIVSDTCEWRHADDLGRECCGSHASELSKKYPTV